MPEENIDTFMSERVKALNLRGSVHFDRYGYELLKKNFSLGLYIFLNIYRVSLKWRRNSRQLEMASSRFHENPQT